MKMEILPGITYFLDGVSNSEITIAIGACGMWRGVYMILSELGYNVKLANPKKTHDIACNKKTDRGNITNLSYFTPF